MSYATSKGKKRAERAAAAAARKTAKAESQKRQRHIQRVVKSAVAAAVKQVQKDMKIDLLDRVDTLQSEVEANLGHRIAQCEDAVENLLVTKSCFEKLKKSVDDSFEKLKTSMDKRFKTMLKKKKKAEKCNEEHEDPAPPLKHTRSKACAARTEDIQPTLARSSSLPLSAGLPPSATPMSNNFAICSSMSDPRTLRMTSHSRGENGSWWIHGHGHVDPPSQQMVMEQRPRTVLGTPRYMSPVFGQRNYAR